MKCEFLLFIKDVKKYVKDVNELNQDITSKILFGKIFIAFILLLLLSYTLYLTSVMLSIYLFLRVYLEYHPRCKRT